MRSKDFNRNLTSLRVLEEFKPKKNGINWDRTIYLTFLFVVITLIFIYIFRTAFLVQAEGQVLFDKMEIQFTDDIDVVSILKREGEAVTIGDTLFTYINEQSKKEFEQNIVQTITEQERDPWIEREIIDTRKSIDLAELQIAELEEMTYLNRQEKAKAQKAVYLDLYRVDKLDIYNDRENKLGLDKNVYAKEIEYQTQYLNLLYAKRQTLNVTRRSIREESFNKPELSVYRSPVDGIVSEVYKENYEVALESEAVMSLLKPEHLFIRVFFKQKDIDYLEVGDVINIEFPDGTKSKGIIQKFHSTTLELPVEFQKKYEPVTRSISADIIPLNEKEMEHWKPFYRLNVKVKKMKFNFL